MDMSPEALVALADWRRRVAELYARIRRDPDPVHAWDDWCATRHELFVTHPRSPIPAHERARFRGPPVHAYDPDARTTAEVLRAPPESVEIANSDGVSTRFVRFAEARFELFGRAATLELLWLQAYGGGIYLSFRDETSGATTYGAGRYLLDTVKGADLGTQGGRLVLDFNFAYNPSCSYDPQWSCPLPPPANRVSFPIAAGERYGDA